MVTAIRTAFDVLYDVLFAAGGLDVLPEARAEADGEIAFDWDEASDHVLSVSIRRDGRISWAALIGEWKAYGHNDDGQVDEPLREALGKWIEAKNRAGS